MSATEPTGAPPPKAREIELKFRVPPHRAEAVARAVAGRAASTVALAAQYFDTPDRRLAAAGLALRLRREGDAWVQTLKGRGDGVMQRLEDEVLLPPGAPPRLELARHDAGAAGKALRDALRGAEPELVFGTDVQRLRRVVRSGGARIELAFDRGYIEAGGQRLPICELEFELQDGPPQALLALAARWLRHGLVLDTQTKAERGMVAASGDGQAAATKARPVRIPRHATEAEGRAMLVGNTLAQILPGASAVADGRHGPQHVHQLRVGLRRLRAVLRAFGPVDQARDEAIARTFAALGADRDRDVLDALLAPVRAAAAAAGVTSPAVVGAGEPSATPSSSALLRSAATQSLWLALIGLAQPPQSTATSGVPDEGTLADTAGLQALFAPTLADTVARAHRRVMRDLRRFATLDDEARHSVRKRAKRLRYLVDFTAGMLPARKRRRDLKRLTRLQDALGHWRDVALARAALAGPDAQGDVAFSAFALGWLARENVEAERRCSRLAARLARQTFCWAKPAKAKP